MIKMPDTFERLRGALRRQPAHRAARLQSENRALREAIGVAWPDATFIGSSDAAVALRAEIDAAARTDEVLLLMGERGVGKSLVARLVHQGSGRFRQPFVAVSCSTLPRGAIGPELFGLEKRGRQGRTTRRLGRLELARGGTLFLDEIGTLPLELQRRLLRFVRHGAVQPIGSTRRLPVDVRVIASTSEDLKARTNVRAFNARLLSTLRPRSIRVAPLRERWQDISTIAEALLVELSRRTGTSLSLDEVARRSLLRYPWPGNVRELQDVLVRASDLTDDGRIGANHLPRSIVDPGTDGQPPRILPPGLALRDIERLAITKTLEACDGNRAMTARRLGLSKKGFYLKLKRLGLWTTAR